MSYGPPTPNYIKYADSSNKKKTIMFAAAKVSGLDVWTVPDPKKKPFELFFEYVFGMDAFAFIDFIINLIGKEDFILLFEDAFDKKRKFEWLKNFLFTTMRRSIYQLPPCFEKSPILSVNIAHSLFESFASIDFERKEWREMYQSLSMTESCRKKLSDSFIIPMNEPLNDEQVSTLVNGMHILTARISYRHHTF